MDRLEALWGFVFCFLFFVFVFVFVFDLIFDLIFDLLETWAWISGNVEMGDGGDMW